MRRADKHKNGARLKQRLVSLECSRSAWLDLERIPIVVVHTRLGRHIAVMAQWK